MWEGRQLKEVTNAEGKTQFEYDANGLRTQKRIYRPDGKLWLTVDYTWENGIIVSQSMVMIMYVTTNGVTKEVPLGPITSKIIYDENNQAIGYMVNSDAVYMFVKNLQGDVIALVDNQGDTVLEYSYDPWGKLEYKFTNPNMDETTAMVLTSLCPLTYRGYNYDFSTGLYYLQSRYYNPEWGRFLNADIYLETGNGVTGANVFAYCDNNPVNLVDYNGRNSEEVQALVAALLLIHLLEVFDFSKYVYNTEVVDFDYEFDKFNILTSKLIVYDKDDKKYVLLKSLAAKTIYWKEYAEFDSGRQGRWLNTMLSGVTSQIETLTDPDQYNGKNPGIGVGVVVLIDVGIYFVGNRIIAAFQKSDYVNEITVENYDCVSILLKPELFRTKTMAYANFISNFKPREKDIYGFLPYNL